MTWAPYITRTELGLGTLNLNDGTNYRMDHPEEGWLESVQWEKHVATSPFYHGEFLVNAVKKETSLSLRVLVFGTSEANTQGKVATLVTAFSQFAYNVLLVKDTSEYNFFCQPADYLADYRWLMYTENIYTMPVSFIVPVHPNYAIT